MRRDGMADNDSYHVPTTNPFSGPFDDSRSALGSRGSNASGAMGGAAMAGGAGAMALGAGSMRSHHSGRTGSPAPSSPHQNGFDFGVPPPSPHMQRSHSPVIRTQSPGMPPPGSPRQYQMRSDSAPNAYARMGSPGPPQQGYGMQRMQSPGPMGAQRSFTDQGGYRGPPGGGRGWEQQGGQGGQGGYRGGY